MRINEHFKPIFNAEMATQAVFQRFLSNSIPIIFMLIAAMKLICKKINAQL